MILREDTPSWAVLAYFDRGSRDDGSERREAFDPRLAGAAQELVMSGDRYEARSAAFILAAQRNTEAEAALLRIHSRIKNQERADEVALAFLNTNNEEGRKRAAAACSRAPDPMCTRHQRADFPSDERTKVSADVMQARVAQLQALGFAKVASLDVTTLDTDAAELLLVAADHAHWFDVETGTFPNQHDSLLRRLAVLVAPELDEAVFEERPPAIDDESHPYGLLAYAGGKRYSAAAQNLGDWYDLETILRLLNAIMADRNAAARFHVLASGDQTAIVVAAPPAVMAEATKVGLFQLGDAAAAERAGKEFELEVREITR